MTKFIGGLFDTQENANLAHKALQESGFSGEDIHMFVRKPRDRTARKTDVQIQDIAMYALLGGVIIGVIGGILGFLVGIGIIPLPSLEPSVAPRTGLFIGMSVIWGIVSGGLTGIILGVAWKLWNSREKAEVTTRQIEKRGVLVTVGADGAKSEKKARRVLEENAAQEVGNPSENWDMEAWTGADDRHPSLKHLVKNE